MEYHPAIATRHFSTSSWGSHPASSHPLQRTDHRRTIHLISSSFQSIEIAISACFLGYLQSVVSHLFEESALGFRPFAHSVVWVSRGLFWTLSVTESLFCFRLWMQMFASLIGRWSSALSCLDVLSVVNGTCECALLRVCTDYSNFK